MPIKFPGSEYRVPKEIEGVSREFVQKVCNFMKTFSKRHDNLYAYLTLSRSDVEPFKAQRRPGMHADGFKSIMHPPDE